MEKRQMKRFYIIRHWKAEGHVFDAHWLRRRAMKSEKYWWKT